MGLRIAVNSGSWSNPTIWNAGALPGLDDIVAANGFTINIDQNINVGRLSTAAVTSISETAAMTSNTTPSGIASSNDEGYGSFAWYAFQSPAVGGASGARWISFNVVSVSSPIWLAYEFTSPKIISIYTITVGSTTTGQNPKSWTFEGWDGSQWIVLDTRSNVTYATTTTSFNFTNSTAYIKYRINITAALGGVTNVEIYELRMFTALSSLTNSVAGGGFTLSGSYTLNLTDSTSIQAGTTNCLTFSGASPVSASINAVNITTTGNAYGIAHTSTGRLDIVGNIIGAAGAISGGGMLISGNGIINIVGNISVTTYAFALNITGGATVNITGNLLFNATAGGGTCVQVSNNSTILNITGDVYGQTGQGNSSITLNIIATPTINITGTIYPSTNVNNSNGQTIRSSSALYLKIIGPILGCDSNVVTVTVSSTSTSAINIFTGPFLCGNYGMMPFLVGRMHLKPTANSYFLFRDNSTNGALSPGAIASASYLYSPSTVVNGPSPNNVRFGTVYASGSQTGQMRVPLPSQVSLGIPVDNTTGSAVLTGADIANSVWNKLTSEITASNSIGVRLKNVSTPAITGAQLTALG